jgi:hypothetical protein
MHVFFLTVRRTHQLRVHMAHIGHPILGDSLYPVPDQVLGVLQPSGAAADQQQQQQQQQAFTPVAVVLPVRTTVQGLYPRLCLHAARLSFRHPVSGEQLTLSALDTVHQQPPFVWRNLRNCHLFNSGSASLQIIKLLFARTFPVVWARTNHR